MTHKNYQNQITNLEVVYVVFGKIKNVLTFRQQVFLHTSQSTPIDI